MVTHHPRMTAPTRAVLEVFLADPDTPRYGLEIGSHAVLPSGTVHPILARLEGLGWLDSGWEDVEEKIPENGMAPMVVEYILYHSTISSFQPLLVFLLMKDY